MAAARATWTDGELLAVVRRPTLSQAASRPNSGKTGARRWPSWRSVSRAIGSGPAMWHRLVDTWWSSPCGLSRPKRRGRSQAPAARPRRWRFVRGLRSRRRTPRRGSGGNSRGLAAKEHDGRHVLGSDGDRAAMPTPVDWGDIPGVGT